MVTKKAIAEADKELACMGLRELFAAQGRPTVWTVLRHVSQSGMSRDISLLTVEDGRIQDITYMAAEALGDKVKEHNGRRAIRVGGCGMDMGFHVVYSLSDVLYRYDADAEIKARAGYVLHHEWA